MPSLALCRCVKKKEERNGENCLTCYCCCYTSFPFISISWLAEEHFINDIARKGSSKVAAGTAHSRSPYFFFLWPSFLYMPMRELLSIEIFHEGDTPDPTHTHCHQIQMIRRNYRAFVPSFWQKCKIFVNDTQNSTIRNKYLHQVQVLILLVVYRPLFCYYRLPCIHLWIGNFYTNISD